MKKRWHIFSTRSVCLHSHAVAGKSLVTRPHNLGKVLKVDEVAHDTTGNLLLQIPDRVDAELEVKILRVTRKRDA